MRAMNKRLRTTCVHVRQAKSLPKNLVEVGVRSARQEAVQLHKEPDVGILCHGLSTSVLLLVLVLDVNAHFV